MRARVIAVAALALALGARAYAVEPAKGGSASGSGGQAAGQESGGGASPAQPGEQGAGSASAQKDPAATEKDPAAKAKQMPQQQSVVGTVEKLEGDSLTVKSSPLSDPHQLKLGPDTKFTRDGAAISRDEISEGDQVRASVEGESRAATEISVIKKGEGKAGGARAAPESSGSSGTR